MDLPQEIDDYLRKSLEDSLGLPVSARTLQLKIRSSEATQRLFRDTCFDLKSELMEKDKIIESFRMNAQDLKKCAEEHTKLVTNRDKLLIRYTKSKWDHGLRQRDLKRLNVFRDQAVERKKKAESCVRRLEVEMRNVEEDLKLLSDGKCTENLLVDELISTLINKDEVSSTSHSFLEANSGFDACKKLLKIWDRLKPSTHSILALASEIKNLQKDKDFLRMSLIKAEAEVTSLFDEHDILDTENATLTNLLDPRGTRSIR